MQMVENSERLVTMSERELLEQVRREAQVSLVRQLAMAMSAEVVYYNHDAGEFTLKMDQRALDFLGIDSVVSALGGVR